MFLIEQQERLRDLVMSPDVRAYRLQPQAPITLFDERTRQFSTGSPVTAFQLRQIRRAGTAPFRIGVELVGRHPIQEGLQFVRFGEIHVGGT